MKRDGRKPTAAYAEEVRGIISLPFYSRRSCRAIIEHCNAADAWVQAPVFKAEAGGRYGSDVRAEYRSASACAPDRLSRVGRAFDEKVNRLAKPLANRLWQADLKEHRGTQVVRYTPGNFYAAHSDAVYEADFRYFTLLCYLNDSFDGGRTTFPQLNYAVAPQAGKAILFPASYLHSAEPVTRGEKYVLVTWLTGPPPIRWL